MKSLTNEQKESYENAKFVQFVKKNLNIENCCDKGKQKIYRTI